MPGLCSNPDCLSSKKLLPGNTKDPGELSFNFSPISISYHVGNEYVRIQRTIRKNGPHRDSKGLLKEGIGPISRGYFFKVDRIGKAYYAVYKFPDGEARKNRIN